MADLRCPNCGHLNPPETLSCVECGVGLGTGEAQPGILPDWLASIRQESAGEPPEVPAGEGSTDWLSQLREADVAWQKGPPAGDQPTWLRAEVPANEPSVSPRPASSAQAEGSGAPAGAGGPDEVPDWLARIRERQAEDGQAPGGFERPPGMPPERGQAAGREEEPDSRPLPPLQLPESDEVDSGVFYPTGGPKAGRPAPSLRDVPSGPDVERAGAPGRPAGAASEAPSPGWLGQLEESPPGRPPSAGGLPHVPALMSGEALTGPQLPGEDFAPDAFSLPEWLGQLGSESAGVEAAAEGRPDLAPATLPAWLEAMRPVDPFRSAVEIGPEEEQIVEAAGPLAGLRGVLLAEPVVAIPRMASAGPAMLEITERQYAQAELMHRLVEEEQREASPAAPRRRRIPIVRWLVAIVLLAAAALPTVAGFPTFPLPSTKPLELDPLVNLVAAAPANRPALVVFDFEPGNAGEMQAVAEPMLDQMMQQGISIATLSTRTAGSMMADQMLRTIGANYAYTNGQGYVNLGYLAGGSTGIQLFAQNPQGVPISGFSLPSAPDGTQLSSPWQVPMVAGVDELADFGIVAVISASGETARSWIEQTSSWLGATPLVMVITTGADPIVRPYYEAQNPQVDGMLSGLPTALVYSMHVGRPGAAFSLWNAYGLMLWAAIVILALGSIPGFVAWLEKRRKTREERR